MVAKGHEIVREKILKAGNFYLSPGKLTFEEKLAKIELI